MRVGSVLGGVAEEEAEGAGFYPTVEVDSTL